MVPELKAKEGKRGYLDGQLLLAMPGMLDTNFERTVIYVCAHSADGAMGFILNRAREMSFCDLLVQLNLIERDEAIRLPSSTRDLPVQAGGPVDTGRGFVLHSHDYLADSTIPVSDELCLTATTDILRAMSGGKGPERATMMLGYASWAPGQLEDEIARNGWLTCPASDDLIFDRNLAGKYDRVLASMGINPAMLSGVAGHA
ncbi:MAG: YqgE/AlgH family protein [Pararhizobium sp.]